MVSSKTSVCVDGDYPGNDNNQTPVNKNNIMIIINNVSCTN